MNGSQVKYAQTVNRSTYKLFWDDSYLYES